MIRTAVSKKLLEKCSLRVFGLRFLSTVIEKISPANELTRKIRNLAIIAHVDHGKTTLVDCLLQNSGAVSEVTSLNRAMDSNILERERGITILSKCTSIGYKGYTINVVDTPGHADFGGEVERALSVVDGVLLVVDATEGPMPQTRFVLGKALKRKLKPIVVFNKIDRDSARCDEVDSEVLELFSNLGAENDQLEYPIIYASAKEGWARSTNPSRQDINAKAIPKGMHPLLDLIVEHVPSPKVDVSNNSFTLLVNNIEKNNFLGKCVAGKVHSGVVRINDRIKALSPDNVLLEDGRVTKIFKRQGLELVYLNEAIPGDIVTIAGIGKGSVNTTLCTPEVTSALPALFVEQPTMSMNFLVNSSPLNGSEGKAMTIQQLQKRLASECETNIALRFENGPVSDAFKVYGRGEMQLGILIETIRREGFELAVSPPEVVLKRNERGDLMEPFEEVTIDCDSEYSNTVIEKLTKRRAEIVKMSDFNGKCRIILKCPTRGLIGYSSEFKTDTRGTGIINHSFLEYERYKGSVDRSRKGALISMADGVCSSYALEDLESRGVLFVAPGDKVYKGMVIGESSRSGDIEVNPCKTKALTNVRTVLKDEFVKLSPPRRFTLEDYIAYVNEDEIIEVTPEKLRLRKYHLDSNARRSQSRMRKIEA